MRQLLCRDREQVLRTHFLCNATTSAPPRRIGLSGCVSDWYALREALYRRIDTIQYSYLIVSKLDKFFTYRLYRIGRC